MDISNIKNTRKMIKTYKKGYEVKEKHHDK